MSTGTSQKGTNLVRVEAPQ